jgi:hypothetical protein
MPSSSWFCGGSTDTTRWGSIGPEEDFVEMDLGTVALQPPRTLA